MQPYFFPYLGYFMLIHSVDNFMFFDDVQYVRKSWMGRNRLLDLNSNKFFFIRPSLLKPSYQASLSSVEFDKKKDWKNTLYSQLKGYKNKAPFYDEVLELVDQILSYENKYLKSFNINSIIKISDWLGLEVEFRQYSSFNWEYDKVPDKSEWGLEISKKLGATHYINSPGGEEFILPEKFSTNNIKLGFLQPELISYKQNSQKFVPGLSIIDVLLFNGKKGTLDLLKNYKINWKN